MSAAEIDAWSRRFALLGDSTRLALLVEMHSAPDSLVSELAAEVGITENAASQSLRALRDQGWVQADKVGRTVRYRLVNDAIVHRILHDVVGVHHSHPSGRTGDQD
ncbi:MAG: metalloregulator ArsR/SmtB family transcription factor [Gordonia sp. (in: high G+C Gram-positive bacteria)]